jgi:aspartate aminotransferase-like enzyme
MKSFNPPIRTLMGPGPSDVHPRILSAMARPTIGHLDPAFVGMMNETKEGFTASTIVMQLLSCAILHNAFLFCQLS